MPKGERAGQAVKWAQIQKKKKKPNTVKVALLSLHHIFADALKQDNST